MGWPQGYSRLMRCLPASACDPGEASAFVGPLPDVRDSLTKFVHCMRVGSLSLAATRQLPPRVLHLRPPLPFLHARAPAEDAGPRAAEEKVPAARAGGPAVQRRRETVARPARHCRRVLRCPVRRRSSGGGGGGGGGARRVGIGLGAVPASGCPARTQPPAAPSGSSHISDNTGGPSRPGPGRKKAAPIHSRGCRT